VDWRGHTTPSLGKIWINGISRRVILDKDQIGYFALMDIYGEVCVLNHGWQNYICTFSEK
jgi:hypothetical protein